MSAAPFVIEAAACTHMGRVRDHNEDSHALYPEHALFILADGMGGHQAGEVASALAVETIARAIRSAAEAERNAPDELLSKALFSAHAAIHAAAEAAIARRGMGTTAVVVWAPPPGDIAWLAHVGDSRAYLWRARQLRPLTEDHTILNQLRRAGVLPPNPDEWPPRHILSQSLGARTPIAPGVNQLALQPEDVLLLCSDGLTDMVTEAAIAEQLAAAASPQAAAQTLVEEANEHGGKDNITAIVLRFSTRPLPR